MFILDKENNIISKIKNCTFSELGYGERTHLQEWIANNPRALCNSDDEDLLIIQKEFDGFNDTNERLDLLALDKSGALVIIENKLDDTGRDVTWQTLKYVSYCSTLKAEQIKDIYQSYLDQCKNGENAADNMVEFFGGKAFEELPLNVPDQRMILVAAKFRKEVTSTAMWMLNHNLRVQCFKATPYKWKNEVFLDIEQIIPVKEAEDYIIKMADKTREIEVKQQSTQGIENMRKTFWTQLLDTYRKLDHSFDNINPTTEQWLSCGSGVSGCPFTFAITTSYASIELGIATAEKQRNKRIFDKLYNEKETVEELFDHKLMWERLDNIKMSRISCRMDDVNIKNEKDWDKAITFLCTYMPKLISSVKQSLKKAAQKSINEK